MRRSRATWIIFAAVVVLAITSVIDVRGPHMPGTIRLGVLAGPGSSELERSLVPFAAYLQPAVRRTVQVEILTSDRIRQQPPLFDLALLPAALLEHRDDLEILAWVKPVGLSGWRNRCFVVRRRDASVESPRLIQGDPISWSAGNGRELAALAAEGITEEMLTQADHGLDPYDHAEALAALAHGAYDVALVRESDLRQALASGLINTQRHTFTPVGPPRADFALVAASSLSEAARRRVRDSALNLDHYRFDRANLPAVAILQALGHLGMAGFAPVEVLPSLRP